MKSKIAWFFIPVILLNLFATTAKSDSLPVRYLNFNALTINDGLSQGMINSIIQDRFGFMWFGTKDGLNRYDGYRFVVYRHNPSDSNSLSDNYVQTIYEDSKGRLWIGTAYNGIDLFNRETETFTHFAHDDQNKNSISDNRIDCIVEDCNGDIWVSTPTGIDKISIGEPNRKDAAGRMTVSVMHFFSGYTRIYAASNGTLWGSSFNAVSFKIQPKKNGHDLIDTLDDKKYFSYPFAHEGLEKFFGESVEDTIHHTLYLISEFSVAAIDTKTNDVRVISSGSNDLAQLSRFMCMDASRNIWLSAFHGLQVFDVQKEKWTHILSRDPHLDIMLNNTNVTYRDLSGNIWIGTRGYGLLRHNPRSEKLHLTDRNSIEAMNVGNDSTIIVCRVGKFASIFNPFTQSYIRSLSDSSEIGIAAFNNLEFAEDAVQDRNGMFWMANSSLLGFDARNNVLQKYGPSDVHNFPLFIDRDQKVWMGTDTQLSCFDPVTKTFSDYAYPVSSVQYPYEFLQCMYQDSGRIFWLGTMTGLLRFNLQNQTWEQFKNSVRDSASLSDDIIFSICSDPKQPEKYLWIGTDGGGLNRFDKQTGKCIRYSMKNGLPNDVVYGILSDDEGNLWMSTNNGLSRFNLVTGVFKNFQQKDGLQGNEFNRHAYCKMKNGWLFFGGVNGFNYFDPKDFYDNPFIPPVQITDFMIRNKPVSIRDKNSPLSKPAYLADQIVLPYSENMITFEFASMDFTTPDKNQYQFKLEGFDKDWIQTRNGHTATYTNLNPGTYVFQVKGSNNDGVWNETPARLQLIVLPPWYMTWWFRLLIGLAIAALTYGIYRYRLQQALHLQAVRNRIARDLHDEIGANLSSISIFSEVANEKADGQSAELSSWLKKINEYTQSSLEAINDIVWVINSRNDRFENIISRMRSLAAELFEARNYDLKLDLDESLSEVKLGMEERKNFYLIYKEALNNIAKYADGNTVTIELKWNRPVVHLKISDNGKGFDESTVEYGNGLLNMKKRAEILKGNLMVHSSPGKGTNVELDFSV